MITANEIRKKSENLYSEYLKSVITEEAFFPKILRSDKSVSPNFNEMRKELTEVIEHSKDRKGFGYTVTYKQINTRKHGSQSLPEEISFQTESDFLKYLHKEKEVEQFRNDCLLILSKFKELREWIIKYPAKIIENQRKWEDILNVCHYFKRNPSPNLHIRELPIQVHTKFIENNKGILKELLDILLAEHINQNEKDFEKRFNLKYDEPQIRFRILDKNISYKYFSGIDDLSIPISRFEQLELSLKKVFVVENKMNVLTFPNINETIVIFGSGFKVENLKNTQWLKNMEIFYWGDLDVQGFEILSQFRSYFPHVKSILMDKETFAHHSSEKVEGTPSKVSVISGLTNEEQELYELLKLNNRRLEQEKISLDYVNDLIKKTI